LAGTIGLDYIAGPDRRVTRAAVAAARLTVPVGGVFVSGTRFENTVIGPGMGGSVGIAVPMTPAAQLRMDGALYAAGDEYRDSRVIVGPLFVLPRGPSIGVFYRREESSGSPRLQGVIAEVGLAVVGISARASAEALAAEDGARGWQGSVGLGWSPISSIELSSQLSLTDTRLEGGGMTPSPRLPLPLLGSGDAAASPTSSYRRATSIAVGMRLHVY